MHVHFSRKGATIEISCTVKASAVPAAPWGGDDPEGKWSARILDVLVSEHWRETKVGQRRRPGFGSAMSIRPSDDVKMSANGRARTNCS